MTGGVPSILKILQKALVCDFESVLRKACRHIPCDRYLRLPCCSEWRCFAVLLLEISYPRGLFSANLYPIEQCDPIPLPLSFFHFACFFYMWCYRFFAFLPTWALGPVPYSRRGVSSFLADSLFSLQNRSVLCKRHVQLSRRCTHPSYEVFLSLSGLSLRRPLRSGSERLQSRDIHCRFKSYRSPAWLKFLFADHAGPAVFLVDFFERSFL